MSLQYGRNLRILCRVYLKGNSMDETYVFYVGYTSKVGFYIVNFFLLF